MQYPDIVKPVTLRYYLNYKLSPQVFQDANEAETIVALEITDR